MSDTTHYGSQLLKEKIFKVKPKFHLFGHVHCNYGTTQINDITFSNAALLDQAYNLANLPRLLNL